MVPLRLLSVIVRLFKKGFPLTTATAPSRKSETYNPFSAGTKDTFYDFRVELVRRKESALRAEVAPSTSLGCMSSSDSFSRVEFFANHD
jgi:hypothetical protein